MKNFLIATFFSVAALQACNNGKTDSTKQANDINKEKDSSNEVRTASMDDAKFLVDVASGIMEEIQLGHAAEQKAENPRAKHFGITMQTDHTVEDSSLKALARQKNVTLPETMGNDEQKQFDEINSKSGADFDKALMDAMVTFHKNEVDEFEKIEKDSKDIEVQYFASHNLLSLHQHLDSILAIDDAVKREKKNK